MKPTQVKLRTYTGDSVKILGTVDVVVFLRRTGKGALNIDRRGVWTEFVRKRLVEGCEAQLEEIIQNGDGWKSSRTQT